MNLLSYGGNQRVLPLSAFDYTQEPDLEEATLEVDARKDLFGVVRRKTIL